MSNFYVRTVQDYRVPGRFGSDTLAYCKTCDQLATELNNKPECHSCSDWSGCGGGCTHSGWHCKHCNITEEE